MTALLAECCFDPVFVLGGFMLPSDKVREFALEESVLWSCYFWVDGFHSTLRQKRQDFALNRLLSAYINEVNLMATKKILKGQSYASSGSNSVQWVNVNLQEQDVDAIAQWLADEPNLLVEYVRLVGEGYAVGVKPARNDDGIMATIISPSDTKSGVSMGVSAYAPNAYDALGVLLYKFVTLMGGAFGSPSGDAKPRFR
jgi:hypothetical protein